MAPSAKAGAAMMAKQTVQICALVEFIGEDTSMRDVSTSDSYVAFSSTLQLE